MPNFHVHWTVSWQALDAIPGPAQLGRDLYHQAGKALAKGVHFDFDQVKTPAQVKEFFDASLPLRLSIWRNALEKTPTVANHVSCFSAYMLGACGPDFWTVTTESYTGTLPDTASHHFDLGHYNRTHEQFRVSIEFAGSDLRAAMERSYFLGMSTHVAGDLILHQLVNVSAGAYNLLKKKNWQNEHQEALIALWNSHNKVEHFWDSYVRYRYLGDYELHGDRKVFADDGPRWIEPLGFLVAETLVEKARALQDAPLRQAWLDRLLEPDRARYTGKAKTGGQQVRTALRVQLELPLLFPARGADRILGVWNPTGEEVRPFIYNRVAHPSMGAYPNDQLYQGAVDEKTTAQMEDDRKQPTSTYNEARKLSYFATPKNSQAKLDWSMHNYLTYSVCPDLGRLQERAGNRTLGKDAFYDLEALTRFGKKAVDLAKSFAGQLQQAYASKTRDGIGDLANFWNLDTGLGLQVQHVPSSTDREIVTRLDFLHVFDRRIAASGGKGPGWTRPADAADIPALKDLPENKKDWSAVTAQAFPIRAPVEGATAPDGVTIPFASLGKVSEPDSNAFLDRIRVDGTARARLCTLPVSQVVAQPRERPSVTAERRLSAWLDGFFARQESPRSLRHPFGTVEESTRRTFALQPVKHRLTLELRIPIADVGAAPDEPALLFYSDEKIGKADASTAVCNEWIKKAKLIGYSTQAERQGPLRTFTARILVNVLQEEDRLVAEGRWNNVVPYGANKRFYGRNFSIATGRRFVLVPRSGGRFAPQADYERYAKVSPTEHIFLSIYPLVRTATGVVDLFSKEEVTRADFDQTVRRISGLEWKKVVLLYDLAASGFLQFNRAFIDGLDVPVLAG